MGAGFSSSRGGAQVCNCRVDDQVRAGQSQSLDSLYLRGLHYQIQRTQGKLLRVVTGTVFDVAVDIRRSSPTFSRWVGVVLSEQNHAMLWVPPGFAHGFLVLSESADFLYRCTDFYAPAYERTIRWNDADLGVKWPLPNGLEPVLSAKDAVAGGFRDAECFP